MSNSGNKFVFVTGGRRSGKSSYALTLGESLGKRRLYVATAQALDAEMEERIARHKSERSGRWDTVEEPLDILKTIKGSLTHEVVIIDCLTLWLCNLIHRNKPVTTDELLSEIEALAKGFESNKKTFIIAISNELGSGITPDNPLSRRFTDLAGAMNQRMAAAAGMVVLTISGVPLIIKGKG